MWMLQIIYTLYEHLVLVQLVSHSQLLLNDGQSD